jgi:hypothetical protein
MLAIILCSENNKSLPEFRKKLRVIGLWGEYGRKAET